MAEGIDLTIESLKEQLIGLKQRISQLRKKGLDTKIAELKAMAIPPKIKLAEATRDYKDVEKANKLVNDATSEVDGIEKGAPSENGLDKISALAEEIDGFLKESKNNEAKECYLKCIDIYKNMPDKNKKEVFARLNGIRAKIR